MKLEDIVKEDHRVPCEECGENLLIGDTEDLWFASGNFYIDTLGKHICMDCMKKLLIGEYKNE